VILHLETVTDYLEHLKKNKPEQDILFQDLLIPVTSFFRDPLTFGILCETVFPEMIKNKSAGHPLRIWIAGCSTGQEVYSIAMCILEYANDHISNSKVQIFATDISENAIKNARNGIYSKKELEGVSENRLQQFFNKTDGHYQVKKQVRDMCVFAVHNFLKDPPSRVGIESLEADGYKVRINIWVKAHGFNDLRIAFQERLIQQFKNSSVKFPGME